MKKVAIVDYKMGNIDSVVRAIELCGADTVVTATQSDFEQSDAIILPGVGAFEEGIENLRNNDLDMIVGEQVFEKKKPLLGICLGMQLFAERSCEGGDIKGLGWIKGRVIKLKPEVPEERVPHVGWNEIYKKKSLPFLEGIPDGKDFYFVHSYHLVCDDEDDVAAVTPYCGEFVSVVNKDNIYGVQFHPEKSQAFGMKLIRNFLKIDCGYYDKNKSYSNITV